MVHTLPQILSSSFAAKSVSETQNRVISSFPWDQSASPAEEIKKVVHREMKINSAFFIHVDFFAPPRHGSENI